MHFLKHDMLDSHHLFIEGIPSYKHQTLSELFTLYPTSNPIPKIVPRRDEHGKSKFTKTKDAPGLFQSNSNHHKPNSRLRL